jgi:hypothetical protein
MTEPSLATLIDIENEIQGQEKWSSFVDGGDGFFYGIKSLTEIGPDFGGSGSKWRCGVLANTGSIYCAPYGTDHMLKINTNDGTVETLDNLELPETGGGLWESGALATDNNIYYMPSSARRIMRLNPDNDSLSSVGDDLGGDYHKYSGTVVGKDDYVYGIPDEATRIAKFDPTNPDTTSTVGEEAEKYFECNNGVLGGDGYIYAANGVGQILKVDATRNNYTWIGDPIYTRRYDGVGWGDPIVGADKCIYWPPLGANRANRVLKFDPGAQQLPLLVGGDLSEGRGLKWQRGALATDGVIYCIPFYGTHILAIDPFKEYSATLQTNMALYPSVLGRLLFLKDEEEECDETFFESSLRKFGGDKVFQLIEECLPSDKEWADDFSGNLPLFMVAASCKNCAVSVIYHLLRRNVHDALSGNDHVGVSKKRKLGST